MALMRVFDHADIACKDSTRIFYGTPNCEFKEYTTKVLPNALVDQLIEMELAFRAEQQIETTQFDPRDYEPKTIEQITELLNDLRKYYTDLTHDPRMSVTWAVMSAGISATDTIALMRQRWPDTDKTRKYETIVNGHKNNAITLGTIYHMIRQHEPDYGRKTNLTPTAFDANTGAKIYTGITAMNLLRQDKFKMKGIIRNG
jgi:hypothetical protein